MFVITGGGTIQRRRGRPTNWDLWTRTSTAENRVWDADEREWIVRAIGLYDFHPDAEFTDRPGLCRCVPAFQACLVPVEDLTEVPDWLSILIRRSKTDEEPQGQQTAILRGVKICQVGGTDVARTDGNLRRASVPVGAERRPPRRAIAGAVNDLQRAQ
jgi:hypothetical protein